jgi:ppGpp synthetase/RelA/SpoT-type nucleotidyltranferase
MTNRFLKLLEVIFNREDKSDEGLYIKKILAEYRNKKPLYEEFRLAVHKLLDALLKENNYKYQIVSRTKTPERLREKLLRKNKDGIRYKSLNEIEDLSGVRVLFYSEADKERFVKELKREMDGITQIQDKKQTSGYEATHIIMTFGEKRLQLPEYKHFYDLKSEVQITSILRHTWAEIEHDFIYKDITGLKKRDPEKFLIIEHKLEEILEKHIKKASVEFEEIIKLVDQ